MSTLAIEHINEFDTLNAGREKINKHAIDPANRAELNSIDAKSVANQANQTSQNAEVIAVNTDDRLDNIIAGEMQDAEVIDARRPFGGEAYATLGERLDEEKAEVSAQLAQTNTKLDDFILLSDYCNDNTGKIPVNSGFQEALNYAHEHKLSIRIDGQFLLTEPFTILDKGINTLFGDGIESSALLFDLDTPNYAFTFKSYHTRPVKLKDFKIRQVNNLKQERNGVLVSFGDNQWGGAIRTENVRIENFTGVLLTHRNCFSNINDNLQLIGADKTPKVSTLLKIEKTPGIFSNGSSFLHCGFQYGRIAIRNIGGANYSFTQCQFEHLELFLHAPLISDPGVSSRMTFQQSWFERIEKGILNSDINLGSLEPIVPITNKSIVNFLFFDNNYDGGNTPTTVLDKTVEPVRSNTFTFASGNVIKTRQFDGWLDISLQNGWTGSLKTYRQNGGLIHLVGNLTPGTVSANTKIADLPFRSEGTVIVSTLNGNSTAINPSAFWINTGSSLFVPVNASYGGSPQLFSIMYYERQ